MKIICEKIEAVIKRKNFPVLKTNLNTVGAYIIDKRNLDDSNLYDESNDSRIGSTGLRSIPLAKIEMVLDISEHAESAYSDEEEFMLDMDTFTDDLENKDEILFKKKYPTDKK